MRKLISTVLVFSMFAFALLASVAFVNVTPASAATPQGWPCSTYLPGDPGMPVKFVNNSGGSVNIYWINYNCVEHQLPVVLPNGDSHIEGTFKTHPFVVRSTADGTPLYCFVPTTSTTVTITDTFQDYCKLTNSAALLTVTVDEGQIASNSGSFTYPFGNVIDYRGYPVTTVSAYPGTAIGNSGNTWTWSFPTIDGPTESQSVSVTSSDIFGRSFQATFNLTVNNLPPELGAISTDPSTTLIPVGSSVAFSANFTDPGTIDTHTATWNWGDGNTSAGTVSESNGSGSVSDSHTFNTPGVYPVSLTVDDGDGGTDTASFKYVVVYDAANGFVTGGGWINSPAGAYSIDPSLAGKATFGFVAKYLKGQSTPSGNTQFQFKAGDLNFNSTSYAWLVVAGANAKFKGVGSINGINGYSFMITATDGSLLGGGQSDGFRIKIWDESGVVYDNMMGQTDDSTSTTALSGGSIVIHK